jgi:transcriptional regulator with XRE-family HTH domain
LAKKAQLSASTVNGILKGKSRGSRDSREALAKALGYQYDEFLALGRQALRLKPAVTAGPPVEEATPMKALEAAIAALREEFREGFRFLRAGIERLQPGSAVPADEFCNPLVRGSLVAPDAQPLKK